MYLGLDIGTSSVKALLIDKGFVPIVTATAPLSVERPQDGASEQDPRAWCEAIDRLMQEIGAMAPKALQQIVSIGLSGQMHGMVALDDTGDILRPAILWNDVRCGEQAEALDRQFPQFRTIGGNAVMAGFTAPKAVWCATHEPEIFAKIDKILLPKDYVRYWLSGEMISDLSDSSGTLWLDVGKRDYSTDLLSACGLRRGQVPELAEGSAPAGRLKEALAHKWGIAGRPVIAGAGDNAAAACGLGVVSPGDGFVSLGTSGVVFMVTDAFAPAAQSGAHAFCHALPNLWHQMGVILSATDSLNWLSDITARPISELAQLAKTVESGAQNCYFHPYLSGERTPHNDANAKGGFIGLGRTHGVAEMAYAVLEGVAFALGDCVDVLTQAGSTPERLIATGGGAQNTQWLQMIADVTNCAIILPTDGDYGAALGAARLGAIASGTAGNEILTKPEPKTIFTPDKARHAQLHERRLIWQNLYKGIKALQE